MGNPDGCTGTHYVELIRFGIQHEVGRPVICDLAVRHTSSKRNQTVYYKLAMPLERLRRLRADIDKAIDLESKRLEYMLNHDDGVKAAYQKAVERLDGDGKEKEEPPQLLWSYERTAG
jgi:hypothetical protein